MQVESVRHYSVPMLGRSGITAGLSLAFAGLVILGLVGCDKGKLPTTSRTHLDLEQLLRQRYLTDKTMPDSLVVIPPPPSVGSQAMANDENARREALALHGTPRYVLAVSDADRAQDATNAAFQCALGAPIDDKNTPTLYSLLARLRLDVRAASYRAKSHYKRPRPYVAQRGSSCAATESLVRDDGSYPSARAAVGWAYALVLSEIYPARQSEIRDRGREFGQSRVVCDAEWQSDVDAGRQLGAAVFQILQEVPDFRSDLSLARHEVMRSIASGHKPRADCAFEERALAWR